jgi:hypothetical protein
MVMTVVVLIGLLLLGVWVVLILLPEIIEEVLLEVVVVVDAPVVEGWGGGTVLLTVSMTIQVGLRIMVEESLNIVCFGEW